MPVHGQGGELGWGSRGLISTASTAAAKRMSIYTASAEVWLSRALLIVPEG